MKADIVVDAKSQLIKEAKANNQSLDKTIWREIKER